MQQEDNNQTPFKPKKLDGRTYTMCGKTFQIYSLKDFDFEKNIDIGEGCGLYCFTKRKLKIDSVIKNGESWMSLSHELVYLGKSEDFTERPYRHEKMHILDDSMFLGIYKCPDSEKPKDVESLILDDYFFRENEKENQEQGNRKSIVVEDSVNLLKP